MGFQVGGLWGGLTIFASFSAAIGDMSKPVELEDFNVADEVVFIQNLPFGSFD